GAAVTLYFLLTGRFPFPGETSRELLQAINAGPPPPLTSFGRGEPTLQGILDRFLAQRLAQRVTNISALRKALEGWMPAAAQLPPLEEAEDDSLAELGEGEDEDVATVMRDFSDVRRKIAELQQLQAAPAPRPAPSSPGLAARPSAPAMASPEMAGRSSAPAPPPQLVPTPGVGSPSRMAAPAPRMAPEGYDLDDEDSDEYGATMLMDTSGQEVRAAIEAALSGPGGNAPPGWPSIDDDPLAFEDEGGQRTIGLAEAGLDFSHIPDPTGGEGALRSPAATGDLAATVGFPIEDAEALGYPPAGDGPAPRAAAMGGAPPMGAGPTGPMGAGPPLVDGGDPIRPVPQVQMYIPEVGAEGGTGLRKALIAALVVLLILSILVLLLWLDRRGTIHLPFLDGVLPA
ncbi:MAG: hypothetical protein KC731_03480, partial [Myxococcales bacterium]|nr:hypothetical protein [Myxococcales bacterium]